MTDWYWQNQQITVLNKWEREGLQNISKVKKIQAIKPLHIDISTETPMMICLIKANLQDYLLNKETNKVVEGDKKFKEVESVWTLQLVQDKWVLSMIEEGSMSLDYSLESLKIPHLRKLHSVNS